MKVRLLPSTQNRKTLLVEERFLLNRGTFRFVNENNKIEWTDKTWNRTGCTKKSRFVLIMRRPNIRLKQWVLKKYRYGLNQHYTTNLLLNLLIGNDLIQFLFALWLIFSWRSAFWVIDLVIDTIRKTKQHRYQILTKRAECSNSFQDGNPENIWLGVTVENRAAKKRIDYLSLKSTIRFLSLNHC